MFDSNNSPTQKNNYFKVGEYLEAIRYVTVNCGNQSLPGMPAIFSQYWECLWPPVITGIASNF